LPRQAPESESWFDEYVRAHGHDPGEPEPDFGTTKNADRLITWNGHEVVCEIKQFEASPFDKLVASFGTFAIQEALNPVRRKVARAAAQLKPLAGTDRPLVVVLANPKRESIPFSTNEIIWALFGDPAIEVPIAQEGGEPVGEVRHTVGRNGQIRLQHQYLSAIVALRRRSYLQDWEDVMWARLKEEHPLPDPSDTDAIAELMRLADKARESAVAAGEVEEGGYLYTEVFTAVSDTATPLPQGVFDGARDSRWDYDAATGNYVRTRG
jgi:hypothetical protein